MGGHWDPLISDWLGWRRSWGQLEERLLRWKITVLFFFFPQFDKYLLSVCCVRDSALEFWEGGQRSETLRAEETLEEFGSFIIVFNNEKSFDQLFCARHCTRCLIQINPHGNSKRLILLRSSPLSQMGKLRHRGIKQITY